MGNGSDDSYTSTKELRAIMLAQNIGRKLQQELPELADQYRAGKTSEMISRDNEIASRYDLTDCIARNAVRYAIIGFPGRLGASSYPGLITDSDLLELIAKDHLGHKLPLEVRVANGLPKRDKTLHTEEGLARLRESGHRLHGQGIGVHAQTREQLREASLKGHAKVGNLVLSDAAKKYAYNASRLPDYMNGSLVDNQKIADELNGLFYAGEPVVTATKVSDTIAWVKDSEGIPKRLQLRWSDEEVIRAYELSHLPKFRRGAQVWSGRVAQVINDEFHEGRPVRNGRSLRIRVLEYERSLAEEKKVD